MKKITKLMTILSLSLISTPVFALTKEETVYTKLNRDGSVNKIIVSEHLINDTKEKTINDTSSLKDIYNTNGDEKFKQFGNKIEWKSNGKDIYYEGTTDKELPISFKIKYELDNKEMKAKDMVGKKGKVKITIDYTNKDKHDNLYTPFLLTTSTIIKNDKNTNINVTNGKVISTGNNNVVVGLALPGISDSLGVNTPVNLDQTVITYETEKFELSEIYMVATPKLLEKEDLSIFNNVDSLFGNLSKISEATKKLEDGSTDLKDGISLYNDKMKQYNAGMNKLSNGSTEFVNGYKTLSTGISNLNSKMPTLQYGTSMLVDGISSLKDGTTALYNGNTSYINKLDQVNSLMNVDDITDSISNLQTKLGLVNDEITAIQTTMSGLDNTSSEYAAYNTALTSLNEQKTLITNTITNLTEIAGYIGTVKTITNGNNTEENPGLKGVNAKLGALKDNMVIIDDKGKEYKKGIDELADGIDTLDKGNQKVSDGLSTLDESIKTLSGYSNDLTEASNTINEGATTLNNGIKEFNAAVNPVISLVDSKVGNIKYKAQSLLKLSDNYQSFAGKENNIEGTTKFIIVVNNEK